MKIFRDRGKKGIKIMWKMIQKKKASANMENERENQVIISEALNKLQKALTVLQVTIENYELGKTGLTQEEMIAIGGNSSQICDLIIIAFDYIYDAQKELKAAF